MSSPVQVTLEAGGRLLRLRLARPKANLIDAAMIAALDGALAEHLAGAALSAVLLDADGPNFSSARVSRSICPGSAPPC
jgi:cyclohexa-1,5-dienecarbonyl-CoA hydratase